MRSKSEIITLTAMFFVPILVITIVCWDKIPVFLLSTLIVWILASWVGTALIMIKFQKSVDEITRDYEKEREKAKMLEAEVVKSNTMLCKLFIKNRAKKNNKILNKTEEAEIADIIDWED